MCKINCVHRSRNVYTFVTSDDLKQDDALSHLLFNNALKGAIAAYVVQKNGMSSHNTTKAQLIGFTNDIDLIIIDRREMEKALAHLKMKTTRIGLTKIMSLTWTKTKYMSAGRDRGRPFGVSEDEVIDDVFEVVEETSHSSSEVIIGN